MKNLALKFSKETSFTSVKVQQLMNQELFPDEEFENQKKKEIYEEAKSFHKAQHGLIRISKYEFSDSANLKRKCLSKNNLQLDFFEHGYYYGMLDENKQNDDPTLHSTTKIWHVNYSSERAFSEWGSESRSQEAAMVLEMPLLHKASLSLQDNKTILTPILFEGAPQWLLIHNGEKDFITWDKKNNVISMMAPYGGDGTYTEKEITFLLTTLFAGFGGIMKRGQKDKATLTEVHTGNWGCGNMRNNKELIYLAQIYVADVLGIDKLIFHCTDEKLMQKAIEKWEAIPNNLSFKEIVQIFPDFNFKWRS